MPNVPDRLFELAFEYRKTKLWKKVTEANLFAIRLSDGRIGYCCVIGAFGSGRSIIMYMGDEGFNSYRNIVKHSKNPAQDMETNELFLAQDCIECAFENKEALSDDEQVAALEYARAHKIRISGEKAYPHFFRIKPRMVPGGLDEDDFPVMEELLSGVIFIAQQLETKSPYELGFADVLQVYNTTARIPLFENTENGFQAGMTNLPPLQEEVYPKPGLSNEVSMQKMKRLQKGGTLLCHVVCLPEPIIDHSAQTGYFPMTVFAMDKQNGYVLPMDIVQDYYGNPDLLLDKFIEGLKQWGGCPKKIVAQGERTYCFLKGFCEKFGISLVEKDTVRPLAEFEQNFLNHIANGIGAEDEIEDEEGLPSTEEILSMLNSMDEKELAEKIPGDILDFLIAEGKKGAFPDAVLEKLEKIKSAGTGKAKLSVVKEMPQREEEPEEKPSRRRKSAKGANVLEFSPSQSFVISVSLDVGLYRHIQISASATLADLNDAIQAAYGFDNDHAYAFFMDNRLWSRYDAFYEDLAAEDSMFGERKASKYNLRQAGFRKGKKFKYLFDFGDEWVFQCSVLRTEDMDTPVAKVVRSKGEAPDQYEYYEEWDGDDDWDDDDDWDE